MRPREQTTPLSTISPVQPAHAPSAPGQSATEISALAGLYAAGSVIARRRLAFPQKDNTTRWNITLSLNTGNGVLRVERWTDSAEPKGIPAVGQHVCIPVTPVIYTTKSGTNFRLTWGGVERGEDF